MSSRTNRGRALEVALAVAAVAAFAAPARAQQPQPAAQKPPVPADSVRLVFDREVYGYQGGGRRDPFTPLTGKNAMGPRFQDLTLRGVIFSPDAPQFSVATIEDATGTRYKVRHGDVVGNTRVVEIAPRRVRVVVASFGQERQETLELRKDQEGTSR